MNLSNVIKYRVRPILSSVRGGVLRLLPTAHFLDKMRDDWDARARKNAKYYIATGQESWTDDEFYASGEETVARYILNDMVDICQGRDPKTMRVLEIGCGAGRITRALAGIFGEVHAVDVSGEMVRLAREGVQAFPNAFVYQNNGRDLSVIPGGQFDFVFSFLVFQHIALRSVVESYVREVHRLLRPGALFKFQVNGKKPWIVRPEDTWYGVSFCDRQVVRMAQRCGFELRYRVGENEAEFWVWYFKPPDRA